MDHGTRSNYELEQSPASHPLFSIKKRDGSSQALDIEKIRHTIVRASEDIHEEISIDLVLKEAIRTMYDGIDTKGIEDALVLAATSFIERDPAYDKLAARLMLQKMYNEAMPGYMPEEMDLYYRVAFKKSIARGVEIGFLDRRLLDFDLDRLANFLEPERDNLLWYLGLRTIHTNYFMKKEGVRLELPQGFWMRVAMGLAINEPERNEKTVEFYNLISKLDYLPSTPTLLHSGLLRPQLSSCYLTTVDDDLDHIFKCIGDNAQMSKWSGGVANDWTNIRSTGALIKSINVGSQGVIPFLKIVNDVTAAINRSGSRRSAKVVYLETWHYDIEDFLDLRRNTGDERRRTHDINTANWVPDLFMKRVERNEDWTLFCPSEVPDLHDLYGKAFEKQYCEYEKHARMGEIRLFKTISAQVLWRKMITRLFETGHPWITFKDPCNVRSPQDHKGVVHSSNLCTEITLNTSTEETAVCNLGSVNVSQHVTADGVDEAKLACTINTAMRMLDNVIDICFYPTKEGRVANLRHRPVGLGMMGLQDALFKLDVPFDSPQAQVFVDELSEMFSYYAILSSSQLAKERGAYDSYKGSKWYRNIFPIDTIDLLEQERGAEVAVSRIQRKDWSFVRDQVKTYGMRNSNTMAIAPTATISNVAGSFPCIEPMYKNLYVKTNMSGEFTIVNRYLVEDLKRIGLWDEQMRDLIKYYDGSIQAIAAIPDALKHKYKEAFELDPEWMVEIAAARGKWLDQSQSHNVFVKGVSGKKISDVYFKGWRLGMKTFYYLRTLGATQIEKSTLDAKKFGFTQKREYRALDNCAESTQATTTDQLVTEEDISMENALNTVKACAIENPDCDSCQ